MDKIQQFLGKEGLGYNIDAAKLSPHHFGIPQIREHIYISLDHCCPLKILDGRKLRI